jgi:hypothetical protein
MTTSSSAPVPLAAFLPTVYSRTQRPDPIEPFTAAVAQLPQPADRLHPAKDLLNQLPFLLIDRVAFVPGRARVDHCLEFELVNRPDVQPITQAADQRLRRVLRQVASVA